MTIKPAIIEYRVRFTYPIRYGYIVQTRTIYGMNYENAMANAKEISETEWPDYSFSRISIKLVRIVEPTFGS